ncbi:DUF805 domain-containing protein [Listeria weihenstephanensis]|uniref:DUF805 domain-containing protein n=1 Tax=Listeria weihenstephanensis TaxID=1006155 RepID=A0A841Z1Z5_9LIST|nr:DUF805 domain-containing protein [Listeria weihenstephanensis]MBC1499225.1 DUF805 domain-containing protein [Listeria weihenstephanensis]
MRFLEAYKSYWKNYVNFSDSASRTEYWYVVLWNAIIISIFYVLFLIFTVITVATTTAGSTGDAAFVLMAGPMLFITIVAILYAIATFIPTLSLMVRRLHDTNRSGWFLLLGLIPFVGEIIIIVLMCLPGELSLENNYDF